MNPRPVSKINLDYLVEQLASLRRHLTDTHGEMHNFHRISASQSNLAYSKFKAGHERRFAGHEILHPHDHLVPALTIFMILNCSSSMVDWIC